MLVEKSIQIKGKNQLTGEIEISGAKNAVLKQMILPILLIEILRPAQQY